MPGFLEDLSDLLLSAVNGAGGMRNGRRKKQTSYNKKTYDRDFQKPILKCSICNGEQVAGFKDVRTGKFEEVMLVRNEKELEDFMNLYGIDEITKEY